MHFAHAFQLDNTRYSVENEAAILVTVHDLLSIVIPASNLRPAQYFDIPLPNITEIIINESNDPTQSSFKTQLVKVALFVRLSSAGGHTLFQNALGQMIPEIGLAFDDITTAEDLKTSIMHSNSHHSRSSGYVMHQEDVSSGLIAEGDGDGRDPPASNDLSTLDELTTIASLATNILPTYHLEMTESFERGHLPKLSQLSKGVENHSTRRSTAESPLDADPSINESSSSANADPTRSGESSRLVGTLLSKFNEPLEIESTFSAQWQRGIATIDRAPEFQDIHHSTLRETHTSIPQKLALELKSLPEDDVRTHKILTPSNDALVKSKSPSEEAATLQVEKNHRLTGRTSETNYLLSHEHNTGSIKVTQRMRDREGEQVGSAASQDGKSRTIARVAKIKTSRSNVSGRPQSPSKAQPKAVKKPQPKEKSKGLKPLVEANPASNDEQSTLYDIPDSPPSKRPVSAAARGKKRVAPRAKLAGEKAASTTKESKQAHSTSSAPPRLKDKPLQDESINENDKIVQDPNGINGLGIGEAVQETHVPPDSISKDAQRNTTISSSKTKQKQSHKVQPSLSNIGVRMPKKTKAKGRNDKRESAPSALTRPGSRRTAALHANLKIQGLAVADDTQEELALATVGSEADLVEMFSQEASDIHNPSKTEQKSASDGAAASHLSKKPAGLCHEEYTKPISGEQIESGNGVTTVRDPGDLKAQVELKTPDVVTIGKPSLNGHVNDDVYIERPIPSEVVHIDTTGDPRNVHGIPGRYGIDKKQETTNHISEKKLDQSSLDMPIDHPVRTEVGGEHSSGPAEQVDQYFENAMVFFDDEEIRAPVEQEAPPVLPLPSNEDIDSILEPNQADHELAGSRPKQFDSTTVAEPIRSAVAMHPDLSMVSTKASGIGDPLAARLNGALSGLKDFGDQRDSLEAKRYTNPQSISAVSAGRLPRATLNSDRMGRTSVGGAQKPGYWKDKGINKGKHRESPLLRPARAANESQALEEGPNKITGVNRPIQAALGNRNLQSQKGEVISISSDKDDSSESLPENGTHEGSTLIALPKASRKRKSNESLDDIQKKIRTVPPRPMKTITPSKEAAIGGGAEKEVQELRAFNLVHRKSAVISFSAQGPRNQGVLSADMSARHSNKSIQDLSESAIKPGLFVERKRTIAKISGPTTKVTTPSEKRRRTIVSVPWTHHGNPPTISDRNTGSLIGSSGPLMIRPVEKPNSQSSRVDGNGSPQPSLYHIRRVSTTGLNIQQMITMLGSAEKSSKIMRNKKDEDVALVIQGNIEGPELDLPELREKPSPMAMSHDPIHSSIRKLLPSSPTAPSRMLEELTAHRVHPSGKFVNLQTDCIIRPAMPQDPFTGATKDRPSTFMQLLRASNAYIDQHVTKTGEVKNHVDPKVTIKSPPREDPDRTMVESEIEQDSRQSSPSLCSTTSDQRFQGRDVPPPSDPSDDDDGAAEAGRQWREALRPHQRGNLDALNDITNVRSGRSRLVLQLTKVNSDSYGIWLIKRQRSKVWSRITRGAARCS